MGTLWQDVRYGLRMLVKSPGFTTVAVLSLALGIGANTAIFSLLNAVLLRSLPVNNPQELRVVHWVGRNIKMRNFLGGIGRTSTGQSYSGTFSHPAYCDLRDRGTGFSDVFAFSPLRTVMTHARGVASMADGLAVSGNFFRGYGARVLIGRPISPDDDRQDAEPVAVITYRFWERYFGSDPNAIGQTLALNKAGFTVIGVLPRHYAGPLFGDWADFYISMANQSQLPSDDSLTSPNDWWVQIMARLAPGADEAQAMASLEVIFRQTLSLSDVRIDEPGILLESGRRGPLMVRQRFAQPLWVLLAVVGLVLLIACINLASLLLARGAGRRHELAVRTAMGATRWRLLRQSFTESMMLSLAGAVLGLVLASWGRTIMLGSFNVLPEGFRLDTTTDLNVLAFTLSVSVLTAVLFGLIPALRAAHVDPAAGLKDRAALSAPRLRLGRVLVSAQIGLSTLLVVGAGLLIQTFANLNRVAPGFDPENLLLFRLNAAQAGYSGQQLVEFYENVRRSVAAIPGVRAVSFSDVPLVAGESTVSTVSVAGRTDADKRLQVFRLVVGDSFFSTMGIHLLLGRDFTEMDADPGTRVMVVNESFARVLFPGENPVGQSFSSGQKDYQIVGVCNDAKYQSLRDVAQPVMYFPYRQHIADATCFEVRSVLPALSLVGAVRKAVAALDRDIPLTSIKTQQQQLDQSIAPERLVTSLCSFLALLAVLLSCTGLYALIAYSVTRRTGEIGVRMAIGARPHDVAWPILREAILMTAAGVAVGIPIALALTRVIRSVLFGVGPHDSATLVGAVVLFLAVAAGAAWIPARRAARIDPMTALRCE